MGIGNLGPLEVVIIFGIILLFFGAKRLPEMARGLGKGIREFKSATAGITRELTVDDSRRPPQIHQPPAQQPIHATMPPASQTQPAPSAQPPATHKTEGP